MYKLGKTSSLTNEPICIYKTNSNLSIPLCADNTDYANFKKEVLAGAELQDADGNVMTDSAEYVRTLP